MDTSTEIDIADPKQFTSTEERPSEPALPTADDGPSIPIHPFAALFPMLDGEELEALAEDIREKGLQVPIVKDATGQLIDGRNRLAACRLAGVDPRFDTVDVEDPIAYILSANVHRRQLTRNQQAMAYAKAYPEPTEKGARGRKSPTQLGSSMSELVRRARLVLRHAPELAEGVLAGSSSLDKAHDQAVERRDEQEQFERLREEAREAFDAVAAVCARRKANAAFLDKEDFVRQVRSDAKEIIDYAQQLADHI